MDLIPPPLAQFRIIYAHWHETEFGPLSDPDIVATQGRYLITYPPSPVDLIASYKPTTQSLQEAFERAAQIEKYRKIKYGEDAQDWPHRLTPSPIRQRWRDDREATGAADGEDPTRIEEDTRQRDARTAALVHGWRVQKYGEECAERWPDEFTPSPLRQRCEARQKRHHLETWAADPSTDGEESDQDESMNPRPPRLSKFQSKYIDWHEAEFGVCNRYCS